MEKELTTYFGYSSFKKGQKETIQSVLDEEETLSILPTGTGKSLCYQFSAYQIPGITVIVCPLLSLMEDQVRQLQKLGEKRVIAINSQMNYTEKKVAIANMRHYKFIFVSPEMLVQEMFQHQLLKEKIGLFVVDEAHCISQWGIDFRPEYLRIKEIIKLSKCKKVLALTATATDLVVADIRKYLFTKNQISVIRLPVNRENIVYQVIKTRDKLSAILDFVTTYQGPGIIYFSSKKMAETITSEIQKRFNIRVAFYHGGLRSQDRSKIQHQFLENKLETLCATSAFGMGINKQDIRYIIHYHLPASLEAYVQEVGRVGRDGKPSYGLLLYTTGDEKIHEMMRKDLKLFREQLSYAKNMDKEKLKESLILLPEIEQKLLEGYLNGHYSIIELTQKLENKEHEKNVQINTMLEYIDLSSCRREYISKYFDGIQSVQLSQKICCDNCINFQNVLEYKRNDSLQNEVEKNYWEINLKKLFFKEF